MREMNKWKDKVELSLDNRQIFFLFFGLSIVGCFVFALGVMVGRRVNLEPEGEVAALTDRSLDLLDGTAEAAQSLSFKDGLQTPATDGLPQTRDPNAPKQPPAEDAEADPAAAKPKGKAKETTKPGGDKADDTALAAGAKGKTKAKSKPASKLGRTFTLQMKAFSRRKDAEAFAEPLRKKGYELRIESHEVKGRIWHRVRTGEYPSWEEGLAAKDEFEKSERVIAYVVRK